MADATPTEISSVERYKYNGTVWTYEYTLNNSGYTAAQWEALNSGITSGLVTKLSALPTNSELTTLLNGKANTSDLTNYYQKSETYTKGEVDSKLVPATMTTLGLVKLYNTNGTNKSGLLVQQDGGLSVNVPTSTTDNNGIYRDDEGQLKANIKAAATNAEIEAGTSTEKAITPSNLNKVKQSFNLATVATSGSYNDLGDKPAIPTKTSDLTNDSGFIDKEDIAPVEEVTKSRNDYDSSAGVISFITGDGEVYYPSVKDGTVSFYESTVDMIFSNDFISMAQYTISFVKNTASSVQIKDGDSVLYTVKPYSPGAGPVFRIKSLIKDSNGIYTAVVSNNPPNQDYGYTTITFTSDTLTIAPVGNPAYMITSLQNVSGAAITYLERAELDTLHKVAITGSYNDLKDKPNIPDNTGKADKVNNPTNGNFAALDSNGNLTDSGHKHSDYLTQHQDLSNYVQKSQTAGLLKNDGTVDTTQYTTNTGTITGITMNGQSKGTSGNVDLGTVVTDVSGKENITPIEAVASGTTAITAQVNKYYEVAGTVSSLTVTLPTPTANTEVTMVVVHLTVGASPTVIVTSVNEVVKFSAAYSVVDNKEYELSCLYNGSKWIVSSMEVAA